MSRSRAPEVELRYVLTKRLVISGPHHMGNENINTVMRGETCIELHNRHSTRTLFFSFFLFLFLYICNEETRATKIDLSGCGPRKWILHFNFDTRVVWLFKKDIQFVKALKMLFECCTTARNYVRVL